MGHRSGRDVGAGGDERLWQHAIWCFADISLYCPASAGHDPVSRPDGKLSRFQPRAGTFDPRVRSRWSIWLMALWTAKPPKAEWVSPQRTLMLLRFANNLLMVLLATTAYGQGTVWFLDSALSSPPDRLVRGVDGQPLVGTNFFAQLYYGVPGTPAGSLIPVSSPPATFRSPTTSVPGTWIGSSRTLVGFNAGALVDLQVRVWDSLAGATWEDALSVGFSGTQHGVSDVFLYIVPAPARTWD